MKRHDARRTSALVLAAALVLTAALAACGGGGTRQDTDGATHDGSALAYRGVAYDTGTRLGPGALSRELWSTELMDAEIGAIADRLHANSVSIFGSDVERLVDTATAALQNGLHVWIQPRLYDRPQAAILDHLAQTGRAAERLREQYARVGLNVGVESTLFAPGIVPGRTFWERISTLSSTRVDFQAAKNRLNAFLERASAVARKHFDGEVTYSAATWEAKNVDWSRFDVVGINYYSFHPARTGHAQELRRFRRFGKPIVITEFGTNAFVGAPRLEGGGWQIVDYSKAVPEIRGRRVRSEQVQAHYLVEMLEVFDSQRIRGAYIYEFISPDMTFSPNPRYDLDLASYGLVRVLRDNPASAHYRWEPKRAFDAVAELYGRG